MGVMVYRYLKSWGFNDGPQPKYYVAPVGYIASGYFEEPV